MLSNEVTYLPCEFLFILQRSFNSSGSQLALYHLFIFFLLFAKYNRSPSAVFTQTENFCLPFNIYFIFQIMFFIFSIQGSLAAQKKSSPPLKRPSSSVDFDKSTGKSNGTADLFSLLCFHDDKQNFSSVPASSWATFDCETTTLSSVILLIFSLIQWIKRVVRELLNWKPADVYHFIQNYFLKLFLTSESSFLFYPLHPPVALKTKEDGAIVMHL